MAAPWRFQPNPKRAGGRLTWFQSWVVTQQARNLVAVAARRSGKTVGGRALILRTCLEKPNQVVGYVGPTLKQAKRLIWRALMRDLRSPEAAAFVAKKNESDLSVEFKNGSVFSVFGAERPEQIRGDGFDLLVADEADDPNFDDSLFDEIIGPALSDQLGRLVQIGSPKGRGRLYREFRKGQASSPDEECDADYSSLQVTAVEAGIITGAEIERARRTRPRRAFQQEYEACFLAPIGIVYDEWGDVHMCSSTPKVFDEIIVGVDWGTSHRGAMIVIGIDRVILPANDNYETCELARIWVLEEHSHAGVGYDDDGWWRIARDIQERRNPTTWYCDPAGGLEGYIRQLRNALAANDNGRPAPKVVPADNQVRPGISAVQQFLHVDEALSEPPRFFVQLDCKWTRQEFGSYRWKSHASVEDEFEDVPVKTNDHCLDAIRYAVFSHFYKPHGRGKRTEHQEDRAA